jgi:hypothetical protein
MCTQGTQLFAGQGTPSAREEKGKDSGENSKMYKLPSGA